MRLRHLDPRDGWRERVIALGLDYLDTDGQPYWLEDRCIEFTQDEVERIETASVAIHKMALAAVEHVIAADRFAEMDIDAATAALARASWAAGDPYVYGRMDLAFDGTGEPKLLEYNADTPTSLLECAVIQWEWMESRRGASLPADIDQFNGLDESLVNAWARLPRPANPLGLVDLHLATHLDFPEDRIAVEYLAAAATRAGWRAQVIALEDIGWDAGARRFVDVAGLPIATLFKLYPWEFMAKDANAAHISGGGTRIVEPAWKGLILSNKAILPILWELFPDSPYLLASHFDEAPLFGQARVRKPMLAREGANIGVTVPLGPYSLTLETGGAYGGGRSVWQAYHPLPLFDGASAVIGAWVTSAEPRFEGVEVLPRGGDPAGIGVRLGGLVTGDASRFAPHIFAPDPARPPVRRASALH